MKSRLAARLPAQDYRPNGKKAVRQCPTLLIVGCGDVGLRLVKWLRQRHPSHRLRIIATYRNSNNAAVIRAAGAIPLHLDLDHPTSGRRFSGFARWMVNLSPPPNDSNGTDPRSKSLMQQLEGTQSRRWVYISTSGVYGDCSGAWVNEARPLKAKSPRGLRRVDGERLHRAQGATVLRAPGIYGTDRLPIDRLKSGTPALTPEEDTFTNHIHAVDLAIMSWIAVFRGRNKRVFNASDDSHMKMGEYFDAVADAFELTRPQRLTRAEISKVVSPMMMSFMSESRRLQNQRMKAELRMRLRYPTVADTLAEAKRLVGSDSAQ
jgi:nucleoside-diphosphate-sugar epimerase